MVNAWKETVSEQTELVTTSRALSVDTCETVTKDITFSRRAAQFSCIIINEILQFHQFYILQDSDKNELEQWLCLRRCQPVLKQQLKVASRSCQHSANCLSTSPQFWDTATNSHSDSPIT